MLERFRQGWQKVMRPLASGLLAMHVTPDMVTWIGTIGAVVMALAVSYTHLTLPTSDLV